MKAGRVWLAGPGQAGRQLRAHGRRLLDGLLARDQSGPRFRAQAVAAFFILVWGAAALLERPAPDPSLLAGQPALVRPLAAAALALLSLETLRHLVLPALVVWLGMRAGARYLDDLFELKDPAAAETYLRLALFGGDYPVLEIKDGDVTAESKRSTAYRIGGPGVVKIHLGNAALFERVDGAADVVAATGSHFLHGFETLREVVDLRDQIRLRTDMDVYTRDGLRVKAVDVQVIFRVAGGGRARSQLQPYPFDAGALRRVVYGRAVAAGGLAPAWAEAVAEKASSVVTRHIGGHLLSQLIAQKEKQGIAAPADREAPAARQAPAAPPPANARQQLSLSLYSEAAAREFAAAGVELIWIGVGTLETPEEVAQELIEAWQADLSARLKGGRYNLEDDERRARAQVLEKFVGEVAEWWRRFAPSLAAAAPAAPGGPGRALTRDPAADEVRLIGFFHLKLSELREALAGRAALPLDVEPALAHVASAARILLGEAGPAAVAAGQMLWWSAAPGRVRVVEVVGGGEPGIWVERPNGRSFPAQAGRRSGPRRFIPLADVQRLFDSGGLRTEPPA